MSKFKIASIGSFGHWSEVFNELQQVSNVDLVAIAKAYEDEDISQIPRHPFAAHTQLFNDYHDMLQEIRPDIVVVSTRLDQIAPVSIAAAQENCHLICEKPLALTQNHLKQLQKTVSDAGVHITAMLNMRAASVFRTARGIVRAGRIGETVLVNARKSYKWGTRPEWFGEADKYGDTIGWVGIHAFDMINFVTGKSFQTVMAYEQNVGHPEHPACQDVCTVAIELSKGALATVSVDFFRPGASPTHGDDWIRVVGTNGFVEASAVRNECILCTAKDSMHSLPLEPAGLIYMDFIKFLSGDKDAEVFEKESFMLTEVCLVARKSSECSQPIHLTT